ncbi:MAG: hypothetical protein ABSF22_04500 [Bryobacteraceae bacterium]
MMRIFNLSEIRARIHDGDVIDAMREALMAQTRGECSTPMPMHLDTANGGEVHMKSSYRRGGKYFALKMASTFQGKGNGMMLLCSAEIKSVKTVPIGVDPRSPQVPVQYPTHLVLRWEAQKYELDLRLNNVQLNQPLDEQTRRLFIRPEYPTQALDLAVYNFSTMR